MAELKYTIGETVKVILNNRVVIGKIESVPPKASGLYKIELTHHRDGRPFGSRRVHLFEDEAIFKTDFKPGEKAA